MKLTPVRILAPTLLVAALVVALVAGCSGGGGDDSGGTSADSAAVRGAGSAVAPDETVPDRAANGVPAQAAVVKDAPVTQQQALIRRGTVELRADDVGKAQFETQRVVDRFGGQVTEEKTTTGDDGKPAYTRMVLRIPTEDFDEAMAALKGVAELETARTSEDDVTTELIDVRTRVKVQKRSIARITTLFDRAQSIRDIMAIEAELARRQAELESLERQLAYLADQTSLSTITVSIDRVAAPKPADDDRGFLAGLSAGWHGLTVFAIGLATALGAVLPWLVVLVVLGPPLLLLLRTIRRRRTPSPTLPTPADS